MINPWIITGGTVGVVVVAGVAFWQGSEYGHNRCVQTHQAALIKEIEAGEKLEAQRIEVARERDQLAERLELQANADPIVVHQCLGPNRVRRLNELR